MLLNSVMASKSLKIIIYICHISSQIWMIFTCLPHWSTEICNTPLNPSSRFTLSSHVLMVSKVTSETSVSDKKTGKMIGKVSEDVENVWMRKNISTIQEMYLTGLIYIFIRNRCISDRDVIKTGQIHLMCCENILSHLSLFYINKEVLSKIHYYNETDWFTCSSQMLCCIASESNWSTRETYKMTGSKTS